MPKKTYKQTSNLIAPFKRKRTYNKVTEEVRKDPKYIADRLRKNIASKKHRKSKKEENEIRKIEIKRLEAIKIRLEKIHTDIDATMKLYKRRCNKAMKSFPEALENYQ
uniref:BZIP domain-containing protein n=1 Tax=Rhabditophanes sp. KR3021 TaxID=114890 RepID=A0AC35TW04_9BILA